MLEVRPNDPKKKISARHTLSLSLSKINVKQFFWQSIYDSVNLPPFGWNAWAPRFQKIGSRNLLKNTYKNSSLFNNCKNLEIKTI